MPPLIPNSASLPSVCLALPVRIRISVVAYPEQFILAYTTIPNASLQGIESFFALGGCAWGKYLAALQRCKADIVLCTSMENRTVSFYIKEWVQNRKESGKRI